MSYSQVSHTVPKDNFVKISSVIYIYTCIYFTLNIFTMLFLGSDLENSCYHIVLFLKYFAISHSNSCNKYYLFHPRYLHNDIFRYMTLEITQDISRLLFY